MGLANRTHISLLLLVLVLAGYLRWSQVSLVGYWTDELCSLSAADGWGLQLYKIPLDQIEPTLPVCTRLRDAAAMRGVPGALARDETHPPIYSLLLRLWENAFGDNEAGTRSLSICFSLAAIVLMYIATEQSVGPTAALWAAMLMAVASPQIMFALESRDYMPALTFCLASTVAILRLAKQPTTLTAVVFGMMALLAMLTHYYSAGILSALVLHAMVWMRGRPRRMVVIAGIVAALAFLAIWGTSFVRELPNFKTNTAWLLEPGPGRLHRWLLRLIRVPGMLVSCDLPDSSAIFGIVFVLLPVAYQRRPELRLWILWLTCTIGLIAGQDLLKSTSQLTLPRYLLFATPAAYVLLAGAVRGKLRWLPPAAGVLLALLGLRSAYTPAWKIDLKTPTEYVRSHLAPGDGLVISGPDAVFDGITFAAFQHYLPKMPASAAVLTRSADTPTLDQLRECPRLWVLWMWPLRPVSDFLPGFVADDRGHLPYFGELVHGRIFANKPATRGTEGNH